MRGKVSHSTNGGFQIRITPAYAGKRPFPHVRDWRTQDHPRLCGEKLLRENGSVYEIRITPAYAGKRDKTFGDECEK